MHSAADKNANRDDGPVGSRRVANPDTCAGLSITRFDREGAQRLPFLSASSLLGLPPAETGAYTLLADGIRQFGDDTSGDLRELWRRLVFSLLASNYDDHLRNHGFLMRVPGKWSLSPAYDLNPVPEIERAQLPKTAITEDQDEPSIDAAIAAAPRFGLKTGTAKTIVREVFSAVSNWRKTAEKLRIPLCTLDAYASAFEHPFMIKRASSPEISAVIRSSTLLKDLQTEVAKFEDNLRADAPRPSGYR